MSEAPHSARASLKQSQSLYRRLLSLIKTPLTEEGVIRWVVDSVFEQFPSFRCTFSHVSPTGLIAIHYTRQPPGMMSLAGRTIDFTQVPDYVRELWEFRRVAVSDVRVGPAFGDTEGRLWKLTGTIARLDVPLEEEDGKVSMLSLSSGAPEIWEASLVDLLTEVGELVALMLREARTRRKLERTEVLFRQFAENVEVVFWMTDVVNGSIVYVSPAYEQIWGRSVESLRAEPLSFISGIHQDDRERVLAAIMRQADESYEQIYRVVQPSGQVRWVKDRGFRVRDEAGRVHRIVGIAEDITPLKQAQESLQATQAKVISNTKFAALGEMASGIAHEINNPLAVIHGLAVQLQEYFRELPDTAPMVGESLASVEKMANRIAAIVKGLRTFSRHTAGDPRVPADLNVVIQETMAMCEAKLRAAKIDVRVNLPETGIWLPCRSSEISQVVLNLVSNAFDAVAGCPEARITVGAERQADGVRIYVEDNGPGVPPEMRERIFQPFFTTKEVGKGTGLGLSISKGIVEAHGGILSFDTSAGITRFVVEIPTETI